MTVVFQSYLFFLPGQAALKMPFQSPVAFSASLSNDFTTSGTEVVPYDFILLNHGDAYNPSTYTFVAPVRGIYFFTVSMGPMYKGRVTIVVNGVKRMMACEENNHDNHYGGDATSGMVQLEVGGQVMVTLVDVSLKASWDNDLRNTFAGFLYAEL